MDPAARTPCMCPAGERYQEGLGGEKPSELWCLPWEGSGLPCLVMEGITRSWGSSETPDQTPRERARAEALGEPVTDTNTLRLPALVFPPCGVLGNSSDS